MTHFICSGCKQKSKHSGMQEFSGTHYTVCEHCGAENQLQELPRPSGAPAMLVVVGLLKRPKG